MPRASRQSLPVTSELTDNDLVARVLAGDTEQFAVLVRRHNRRLFRVARAIVVSEAEAEDIVQDTHVTAFVKLAQFQGRASYGAWITKIAVHDAYRRKKRAARVSPLSAALNARADPAPSPEHQTSDGELRRALEAAIDGLREDQRVVFVMRDLEHASTAETAETLDLTEENVRVRLHRARAALRERLLRQMGDQLFPFAGARCDRIVVAVFERIAQADA